MWLWLQTQPERVDDRVRDVLASADTELLLSAASAWEIAIKYAIGKLPLPEEPRTYVPSRMRRDGVAGLPVTIAHTLRVATLPYHHGDPFDRLLVVQSQFEDVALVTADPRIERYDVEVLRAV